MRCVLPKEPAQAPCGHVRSPLAGVPAFRPRNGAQMFLKDLKARGWLMLETKAAAGCAAVVFGNCTRPQ